MAIRVQCSNPDCRDSFYVSEAEIGRTVRCEECGQPFSLTPTLDPGDPPPSGAGPGWNPTDSAGLEPGSSFGRYRIVDMLGRGLGPVLLAYDTRLDRRVALKVLYIAPRDGPEVVGRYYREADAAATLDHPNLCPVFEVGQVDGIHYLTMPYIQGKPLSEAVDPDKPVAQRQAAAMMRKLALASEEAHRRGLVHRELKPGNILIGRNREPVILGFGPARPHGWGDARLTEIGAIVGTPAYMAPEQARGDVGAIGPRTDVYSLGVILYELLTGRRPFEGNGAVVLAQVLYVDPASPSSHRPELDDRIAAICLKAMAKRVGDRYPSMAALAEDLGSYLREAE